MARWHNKAHGFHTGDQSVQFRITQLSTDVLSNVTMLYEAKETKAKKCHL